MIKNLLQKIIDGKYTNSELAEIIDHAILAKQTYNIVEQKIENARNDEFKAGLLKEVDDNIINLKGEINSENKKQSKFILGLIGVATPILIALTIISAFITSFVMPAAIIGIFVVGLGSIPIALIDRKKKALKNEISNQEKERAFILSDTFFNVPLNYEIIFMRKLIIKKV